MDLNSPQIHQTLSGHNQLVNSVDIGKASGRCIVSSGYDHHIKLWDLERDINLPTSTQYVDSICNSICLTSDESIICLGHVNGKITFLDNSRWGTTRKYYGSMRVMSVTEVHTQSVTSSCCLQNRNLILSSGRDKLHNMVDTRTRKVCWNFKIKRTKVAMNRISKRCASPDDNFVAVGSDDGSVSVWSLKMGKMVKNLTEHNDSVLGCSWSEFGTLESAYFDGNVCIWS